MILEEALAVLKREKHNGHERWDGTCPPSSAAWRTEFECIAIAEKYERQRIEEKPGMRIPTAAELRRVREKAAELPDSWEEFERTSPVSEPEGARHPADITYADPDPVTGRREPL